MTDKEVIKQALEPEAWLNPFGGVITHRKTKKQKEEYTIPLYRKATTGGEEYAQCQKTGDKCEQHDFCANGCQRSK